MAPGLIGVEHLTKGDQWKDSKEQHLKGKCVRGGGGGGGGEPLSILRLTDLNKVFV
jgi:hypothetical protein